MSKSFLKQFWVAFKIWSIALAANTLLGSLYLAGDLEKFMISVGLLYGAIFSIPIFIILLVVIQHCASRKKNGLQIFQYVFIFGLLLTIISAVFFLVLLPEAPVALLMIAMLSAVIGTGSQYNSLFKLADYDGHLKNFLHEN